MGSLKFPKPRSMCLVGPTRFGKKHAIDALCTEMDAVVFDLSAEKVTHVENMPDFLSFILTMARKLQPTVILIEHAHKPFIKKVSIEDRERNVNPKKIGNFLYKNLVNKITINDKVMVIGWTNEPWNCQFKKFRKCFERVICFPVKSNYATTMVAWMNGLVRKNVFDFNVCEISALTKYTIGYKVLDILETIDRVVTLERRMR